MRRFAAIAALGACAAALYAARGAESVHAQMPPVSIALEGKPARMISEYHLFKDPQRQIPNEGVLPYDLTTPLFTDYAAKYRFVWMPPGTAAKYDPYEAFDFPLGTVLVKTFAYPKDPKDPAKGDRLIETRLLIRQADQWKAWGYLWNDEGTDARLAVAGAKLEVALVKPDGTPVTLNYLMPNMNQCKECHANQEVLGPVGPKARYLNRDYAYAGGTMNQLAHWTAAGYLEGAPSNPAEAPRAACFDDPASGSVAERARAWLDINCAHCHNPKGPAFTSGLDLSLRNEDPMRLGVLKPPVAAGRGAGDFQFGIAPGKPDESILVHRLKSTELGVMMAPLGRSMVHDEGLALIREWIAGMPQAQ